MALRLSSVAAGSMNSAWQSPPIWEARSRMHGHAPAMLHIRAGDGRSRCRTDTLPARSPEREVRLQRLSVEQLETRHRQTPTARWYRESLPVFRFDILKFSVDDALDSAVFTMEMLQPASQIGRASCREWEESWLGEIG